MQVIIVGGGIAGLSLALSLHQIGIACRIYESVPKLEPLGLGINLQPNAVRELTALGLGEQLAGAGILTAELAFYNRHGQLIWSEPRGKAAGYRWPQISISRGRLQEVLLGGQRDLGSPGGVQPYVGLSLGIYWIRQTQDSESSAFAAEDVLFGVAPEVGLAIPLRREVAMIFSTRYDVPFSGADFLGGAQSFRYWSLGLGLAYVL